MDKLREQAQLEAFNAWRKNNSFGTIEGATGFGKTRIGVMAASYYAKKYNYNFSILIVVPDTNLRDNEWKAEFEKWGEKEVWDKCVEIECIHTAWKWEGRQWDLVIADEIHDMVPSITRTDYKYGTFFYKNRYRGLLGLSGSISKGIRLRLKYIAPVVYSLHTEEAKDMNFVSDFIIYTVGVSLTPEEMKEYRALSRKIEGNPNRRWSDVTKRIEILYRASNKLELTKKIIQNTSTRGLLFNMRNEVADYLSEGNPDIASYHSGYTKKQRAIVLNKFKQNELRVLSTTKALNQGANLSNLKWAVIVAGTSKEKDAIQRLGRIIRKEDNKKAILIRLYCKDTVEQFHLEKSLLRFKSVAKLTEEELLKQIKDDNL